MASAITQCGRPVDGENTGPDFFQTEWAAQGQGQGHRAFFPVGSDDDDLANGFQVPGQGAEPVGKIAVIVGQQEERFQRGSGPDHDQHHLERPEGLEGVGLMGRHDDELAAATA